jgi:hypothetical protein
VTRALAAVLLLVGAACVTPPLDRSGSMGSESEARLQDVPVCGYPVRLEGPGLDLSGELLAIDERGIWVAAPGKLWVVEAGAVQEVTIEVLPDTTTLAVVTTILGSLSTASHGAWLVASLPLWLATGIFASLNSASIHQVHTEGAPPAIYQFARFPQGMPRGWPGEGVMEVPVCGELPWKQP